MGGSMGVSDAHLFPAESKTAAFRIFLGFAGILFTVLFSLTSAAYANWRPLKERLVADGFAEQQLLALFSRPEVRFEPKAMAGKISLLIKHHQEMPSGVVNYNAVHKKFLRYKVIEKARSYMMKNENILKEASASYCVPAEIIVSILLVETQLGSNTGGSIAFNRLASMANSGDLDGLRPYLGNALTTADEDYARTMCRQKSDWAYNELKALLNYAGAKGVDPLSIRGSIYGAIGLCQFMPSNVFSYGVDADTDGQVDLLVL